MTEDAIYTEVYERHCRKVDPDLEGYSVADLVGNLLARPVYVAHGYAGEHITGVFATLEAAVEALQDEARKYGHTEFDVGAIDGTNGHDLDGFTVDEWAVTR